MVFRALLLVALVVLSSGCAGEKASTPASHAPVDPDPKTSGNGGVKGAVTDDERRPIVGGSLVIKERPEFDARTDEAGDYRIREVPPGTYTLSLAHEGFASFAQRVDIFADQFTTVNIVLEPVASDKPRQTSFPLEGYMQLGASTPFNTFRPSTYLNDKLDFQHDIEAGALGVVTSMAWQSSAPLTAKKMRLDVVIDGVVKNQTTGPSPLLNRVVDHDAAKTTYAPIVKADTKVEHGIWLPLTCDVNAPAGPGCTSDPPSGYAVVVYEQRFSLYVTIFYGEPPPDGFTGLPA